MVLSLGAAAEPEPAIPIQISKWIRQEVLNASGKCMIADCRPEFKLCYKSCLSLMHFFVPSKFRILKSEVISLSGCYGVSVSCDLWRNIWVSYYFRLLHYVSCRAAMLSSKRCKLRFIKKVATRNISDFLLETAAAAEWSADNPLGNRGQRTVAGTLNPAPARKHGDYFQDHCPHFSNCSKNAQGKNIFDILYLAN